MKTLMRLLILSLIFSLMSCSVQTTEQATEETTTTALEQTQVGDIPTPESHFGFKIGTDKMLAHPDEINAYLKKLEEASGRIIVEEVGRSTDGNPYMMVYISSEENIRNLEKYKEMNAKLADPRTTNDEEAQQIIRDGKTIVGINESIHATEVGPAQGGILTAYRLVSENTPYIKNILDNVILVLSPHHNPDGNRMVVDWWRKYKGTEYEGSGLPYLYQRYTGHDNNRDWYMFTQKETQITIKKLYDEWNPQIVVDQHQMGSGGARIFVPPFVDPWEPNIDPILQVNVNMLGTFMQNRLIAKGFKGVNAASGYDSWTPGRAFQHYHGAVRILTETASVRIAAPVEATPRGSYAQRSLFFPVPWEGGTWSLSDVVEITHEASMAVLENAALNREVWLSNFYQVGKNAVVEKTNPYAVIIPAAQSDPYTTKWLIDILQTGLVEVYKALEDFTADGKQFKANSAVIYMNQPYYSFAKTLLERQEYPELRQYPGGPLVRPYDLVAHTLPLLMGVDVTWINDEFSANTELMSEAEVPQPIIAVGAAPDGYIMSHESNAIYIALNRFLPEGIPVYWASERFVDGNTEYPIGTVIIPDDAGKAELIRSTARELNLNLVGRKTPIRLRGYKLEPARVGLFKSWSGNMNEGWTRWVFEKFEFDMESAHNVTFTSGGLNEKYNTIVFAGDRESSIINGRGGNTPPEYQGGIGEEGLNNLKEFVRNGGTLITYGSSNAFAIEHFNLDVTDASSSLTPEERREISAPGSILKTSNTVTHPIAYGLPADGCVFYRSATLFDVFRGTVVSCYPDTDDLLLSGWLEGGKYIKNKPNVVEASFGQGRIVLIGFDPIYRAQAQTSFKYIFNTIFYSASQLGTIPSSDR